MSDARGESLPTPLVGDTPNPAAPTRSKVVAVRLSEAEHAQWRAAAAAAGRAQLGRWARETIAEAIASADSPRREAASVERAAVIQVRRVGANLNQLTRLAHQEGLVEVAGLVEDVLDLVDEALARLVVES